MPVSLTVVKRLFAKSGNQCAMPWCKAPLVVGDLNIAEICHIRARRKGGPRFDADLTAAEKDAFDNLLLLCPTHHTEADKNPAKFTVGLLTDIKKLHESAGEIEITPAVAARAELILSKHLLKAGRTVKSSPVKGGSTASASGGSVAVSIAGHNQGPINIRVSNKTKDGAGKYPANSIGADANLSGYIDYLCDLYVKYMASYVEDKESLWGRIGKHIKAKFRLVKRSRNHLPAEKFQALVDYLIEDKLEQTPVGKKHKRNGTRICCTFDEWRSGGR